MKKLMIFAAALLLAACGNRTNTVATDADSTQTAEVSDTLNGAEAVAQQLEAVYAKLREMDASEEGVSTRELDRMFCSEEFLLLEDEVFKKSESARSSEEVFSDEGWRWFPGIGVAQKLDSVSVEVVQKGRVEARFRLTDKQGNAARQHLVMLLEKGKWKIHNWIDADAFPEGNYLDWMKMFLGVQTGEVMAAPDEDWTEEAVAKAIRQYYDAVNKTFADGSALSPFDLDKKYYTKYWNEVYDKVNEKDSSQPLTEKCFFVDDAHWTSGLDAPVVAEDIKVELTTGDTAEAVFKLREKESGFSQKVMLLLEYEKGQWRIHNILETPHDYSSSVLSNMEKYIE